MNLKRKLISTQCLQLVQDQDNYKYHGRSLTYGKLVQYLIILLQIIKNYDILNIVLFIVYLLFHFLPPFCFKWYLFCCKLLKFMIYYRQFYSLFYFFHFLPPICLKRKGRLFNLLLFRFYTTSEIIGCIKLMRPL